LWDVKQLEEDTPHGAYWEEDVAEGGEESLYKSGVLKGIREICSKRE
jgi:hypothetical protein